MECGSICAFCKHESYQRKQLQNDGEDNENKDRSLVENTHHPTAEKPGDAETSIEQTKTSGSDVAAKQRSDDGFQERILGAHADSPKNHSAKDNPRMAEKDERREKRGNQKDGNEDGYTSFIKPFSKNEGTYSAQSHRDGVVDWNNWSGDRSGSLKVIGNEREVSETGGNKSACN